jgi:sugar phosphate isomerase/epimerase
MYSRREFTAALLAVIPAPLLLARVRGASQAPARSRVNGVRMGLQSACFTFSGMGLDDIIETMTVVGLAEIDMMSEHVEQYLGAPGVQLPGTGRPGPWVTQRAGSRGRRGARPGGASRRGGGPARGGDPVARQALRDWRLGVDLGRFADVGRRFRDRGLNFFSYNLSFNDTFTDEEIERGMLMAKAIGTRIITASSPVSIFPRLAPFAERHDVIVALHNHTIGPGDFEQAVATSPNVWINLDVGHFFASGYDPVGFLRQHHARITNLHVKDRMKNQGPEMPFGEGETPLADVLRLVRDEHYDLPVCIEYVGPEGPRAELTHCFDYCKQVLNS